MLDSQVMIAFREGRVSDTKAAADFRTIFWRGVQDMRDGRWLSDTIARPELVSFGDCNDILKFHL